MVNIHMPGAPECPLCLKRMREVVTARGTFYICVEPFCMVSINKKDPMIHRWKDIEKVPCPLCGKPMRIFVRSDKCYKQQCHDPSHRPFQYAKWPVNEMPPIEDTE